MKTARTDEPPVSDPGRREALYALYRPNVSKGNYGADIANRGANEMLKKVLLSLGLERREDAVERRFKVMDEQAWDRSEERLARINREQVAS